MSTMMQTWSFDWLEKFPPGPWDGEPDKGQWVDASTDLDCMIHRHPQGGHLCGYVGVGPSHPLHGKDTEAPDADVHGGLTFAAPCDEEAGLEGICHVPEPGREGNIWWFGFDCHHYMDKSPYDATDPFFAGMDTTYRNWGYVTMWCTVLAAQLKAQA
jgi:hypothetical protein